MQSSIAMRPRILDDMIGQERIIKRLRGSFKKKKLSRSMMFTGKKGSGKTSLARIIAVSLQCTHQDKFGNPCIKCRKLYKKQRFPIYELDCGKVRSVDDVEKFIERASYDIIGLGRFKVFIFDEAHRLSGVAQDSVLKFFEEDPNSYRMICSTRAGKIVDTLRSRCRQYPLKPFNRDDIEKLVTKILKKEGSKLDVDDLVEALIDNKVDSGRLIANAVDEYISGAPADEAAQVEGTTEVDSKALCRATIKGAWPDVARLLQKTSEADIRLLRASVVNYLRSVLLDAAELNDRNTAVADAIKRLTYVTTAEDSIQLAALAAELFTLCKLFADYPL